MSIGILSNSYSFLTNFKDDSKCQNFINNLDYFVKIGGKSHDYFNRYDVLCSCGRRDWEIPLFEKYKTLIYLENNESNNLGSINTEKDILNELKDDNNIFYDKILKNNAEMIIIDEKYIKKYAKYFKNMKYRKTKGKRSNCHAGIYVLLMMLSKYPDHKIYLIGFNYSEDYIFSGKPLPLNDNEALTRRQENDKIIAHCPILNKNILDDIIKTHDNVLVKNSFE